MTRSDPKSLDRVISQSAAVLQEIDQLQDQVAALTTALEHRERLATLGTIAGLIAHEFNNILTPVMSYAQMAMARPEDRELSAKAHVKAMEGAERAAAIAAAILGFVRDDSPGVPRGTSPVAPVHEALERALECLAREPEKDAIQLVVDLPDGVAMRMRPVALQHVLLNLILNARAAMLPGGGVLAVRARRVDVRPERPRGAVGRGSAAPDGEGPWVVVEVEDTGRGMSPARLARLFEPFYTEGGEVPHGTSGDRRRGTGLGMTICQKLVEDAGGAMWVESEVGRGTRVVVAGCGGRYSR
jgi:signal transduction histidine kinase